MSIVRIARLGVGMLLVSAPLAATAAPVVPRLGHATDDLVAVRYDNCRWRNGHRVCVRTDSAGDSLVRERYMRPRDFRERDSNDRDIFFNNRQQGGSRSQGSERYQ